MTEQDEQAIKVIFPNKEVMSQVVNAVVKKKPLGWARKSYATYYSKHYAEWIKKDIDGLMLDRAPRIYRYSAWPRVSARSLYLRINQALRFLLDNLDPDSTYANFMSQVRIKQILQVGVSMALDEVVEGNVPHAEVFIAESDAPKWKQQMEIYLDAESDGTPFHKDNLALTPAMIQQVELELSGLENIIWSVTSKEIKIMKG